jgi:hypothetical protein
MPAYMTYYTILYNVAVCTLYNEVTNSRTNSMTVLACSVTSGITS